MIMKGSSMQRDIAYTLAKNVVNVRFDDLPDEAVEAAKKSIIDTLGVIVGASGITESLAGLMDLVRETGGTPESTIVGFGGKVPAIMGAFANGAMVHCLDYDDIEYDSTYHPSGAVVPAGFAIAERNRPIGGREFIAAVALGQDLGIRLALAIPGQRKPPWHRSCVLSTFAATATVAKLLRLDDERVVDALGIALCQSAGPMEIRWGLGTDLGGLYFAFPAKAGVLSALLAQKGVAGIKNCFEGRAGLFNLYFEGKYDPKIDYRRDLVNTLVSLNPIMVDGTGLCGCCRVRIYNPKKKKYETKFACVDGPVFNGLLVDFESLLGRTTQYKPAEERSAKYLEVMGW